jgi:GT2 family glycosyltransferase|tara:strand:+ start:549 stop:1181 length:633 start_codon:yes stop_codon:yes gene_type:complete
MEITIGITTYNRRVMLMRCLKTLFADIGDDERVKEVMVVDLGSSDGTQEMVNTRFPNVRLIQATEIGRNRAAARNRVITESKTDWTVVSEDDIYFKDGWLNAWCKCAFDGDLIFPSGFCIFMVHRALIEKVGLLDEGYVDGRYDDMDYINMMTRYTQKTSVILKRVAVKYPDDAFFIHDWNNPGRLPNPLSYDYYTKKWGIKPNQAMGVK